LIFLTQSSQRITQSSQYLFIKNLFSLKTKIRQNHNK